MMSVLEEARTTVEQAMAKLDEDAGALWYEDGRPAAVNPEAKLQAFRDKAARVTASALEAADTVIVEAKRQIQQGDNTDPISRLSPEALARASNLREFVAEDCARLTVDQLVARCAAVLETGDLAQIYLHARYSEQRAQGQMRPGVVDVNGAGRVAALNAVLRQMGDKLGTSTLAPERLRDAKQFKRWAQGQHQRATGAQAEAQRALISSGKYSGF